MAHLLNTFTYCTHFVPVFCETVPLVGGERGVPAGLGGLLLELHEHGVDDGHHHGRGRSVRDPHRQEHRRHHEAQHQPEAIVM